MASMVIQFIKQLVENMVNLVIKMLLKVNYIKVIINIKVIMAFQINIKLANSSFITNMVINIMVINIMFVSIKIIMLVIIMDIISIKIMEFVKLMVELEYPLI